MKFLLWIFAFLACGFHGQHAARTGDTAKQVFEQAEDKIRINEEYTLENDLSVMDCSDFVAEENKAQKHYELIEKHAAEAKEEYVHKLIAESKCTKCIETVGYDYNVAKLSCDVDCGRADVLCPGESLGSEEVIKSSSGSVILVMQADGNLVMYNGSRKIGNAKWQSKTDYTSSNRKVWQKGILAFQKDFNAVIYPEEYATDPKDTRNGKKLSDVGRNVDDCSGKSDKDIELTMRKTSGREYWKQCDKTCRIILQDDCNLVMYKGEGGKQQSVMWDLGGARCPAESSSPAKTPAPTPEPTLPPTPKPTIPKIIPGDYALKSVFFSGGAGKADYLKCKDKELYHKKSSIGAWEKFHIEYSGSKVSIRSKDNNRFLNVEDGGGKSARCGRKDTAYGYELFTPEYQGSGQWAFKTQKGPYLRATHGNTATNTESGVDAQGQKVGEQEKFWLVKY